MRFLLPPLLLTFLIHGQAQARVACATVYRTQSVEALFQNKGKLAILSESQWSEFISSASIAVDVPSHPFRPSPQIKNQLSEDLLAFEGLPVVQAPIDPRVIPVISKVAESPYNSTLEKLSLPVKPPSLESRGQFLMQLADGSWVGAKPLLSTLIFDHGIRYQDFRFGSALDEMPELAKGVRLAIELGEAKLSAKVYGIWFDLNGTPYLIHALTHSPRPQRQQAVEWTAEDLLKLESIFTSMETNLKAETLNVFAIERRDLSDENLMQSLKHDNQESPIRFEKEQDGRIQVSAFKYSNWYFQKFGMDNWLKALGPQENTPPSGIETPFNSRNGLFTLIRLENLLKASPAEAQKYLQALQTSNPRAHDSLFRLITELNTVEKLKPFRAESNESSPEP